MEIQLFVVCQRHSYFSKYTQKNKQFFGYKDSSNRTVHKHQSGAATTKSQHSRITFSLKLQNCTSKFRYRILEDSTLFFFFTSCIGIFIIFNFVLFLAHCPNCNCIPHYVIIQIFPFSFFSHVLVSVSTFVKNHPQLHLYGIYNYFLYETKLTLCCRSFLLVPTTSPSCPAR